MKKQLTIYLMLALAAVMSGCSSTGGKEMGAAAPVLPDCHFPGTKEIAPGWVCDRPVPGWAVTAAGSAEKTGAGFAFQKQMAMTNARVQLAQQMKVHVANMVKQYAETSGSGDSETVDRVNTSVTKQITDETVAGSKPIDSVQGPDGILWILVGLDDKSVEDLTKAAIRTSMNNDHAVWQKLQADKAQDELANEIAKQKTGASH
jgi:LPP20 lipoprotein